MAYLQKVLGKCQVYQIYLNPEKCKFMVCQGKILGHIVSKNDISTYLDKISVIVKLPRLVNPKGVQIFMGHFGYYRHFIYMYAEIARPMHALLVVFDWSPKCEISLKTLKKALIIAPILRAPDWNKKIISCAYRCISLCYRLHFSST